MQNNPPIELLTQVPPFKQGLVWHVVLTPPEPKINSIKRTRNIWINNKFGFDISCYCLHTFGSMFYMMIIKILFRMAQNHINEKVLKILFIIFYATTKCSTIFFFLVVVHVIFPLFKKQAIRGVPINFEHVHITDLRNK